MTKEESKAMLDELRVQTKGVEEILNRAIENREIVSIIRESISDGYLYGIPIYKSENLMLMHYFVDFYYDGFKLIRLKDITKIERRESDIFFENILKKEGLYFELEAPKFSNIDGWKQTLRSVCFQYTYIIIERELTDKALILGKVVSFEGKGLHIQILSPLAKWEGTDFIAYDEITCVTFNDGYSKTLTKYIY